MTNEEILERVIQRLPYPNQIEIFDLSSETNAICFRWRAQSFRVDSNLNVDTARNGMLIGDDASIILSALLKGGQP